jgi:signal transduction histidine kinase
MASGKAPKRAGTREPPSGTAVDLRTQLDAAQLQMREAAEREAAIAEILRAISSSPTDVQSVLDTIVEHAVRYCAAEDALINLLNDDGTLLIHGASYGPFGARPHLPKDRTTLTGRAVIEKRTVHVSDLQAETAEYPVGSRVARELGFHTAVATPLLRDGVPFGAIILRRLAIQPFTEQQLSLLHTFAAQAVIAIENVRLFNDARDALERQTASSDILKVIATSPTDVQPVLDAIAETAARVCGASDAHVYRVDGDRLRQAAHFGPIPGLDQGESLPLDRGSVIGRSIVDREAVHIRDAASDLDPSEYPVSVELQRRWGYRTTLSVPLLRDNLAIGGIAIRRTEVRPFTPKQVELLQTFAAQAVIAIENVRLFNETKEALERQTAISEILRIISASPTDALPVLEAITENALRFCAAEDALVVLPDGGDLRLAAHRGPVPVASDLRYPNDGTSMTSRAFLEARTIAVQDLQTAADFPRGAEHARAVGHHAVVVAPLLRDGAAIGTINLRRFDTRPFSDREIEALETFAAQAVIAIENVRLFKEIQEKSAQLAEASRHKSEFLANMSHELRTPLNAVIGFSDVLEQRLFGELSDRQSEYVRDIASSGRHLLDLVNEILDLSKVEAGRMELEPGEFALAETIRGTLAFVRERAARQTIELAADVPPDLGTVVADERKIRQVLLNLLSNAVKFTPDGGTIAVRAQRNNGEVQVSVRDTGIGIAPEDQAKVFDEFQQVGKASDRSREGTGLGLTLAKRFIELHGGRIWVESELGKGTTFTFAIPVGPGSPASEMRPGS